MALFQNTRTAISKTIDEIKLFILVFTLISEVAYVGYLIYAIIAGLGNLYVNITLIAITAFYTGLYVANHSTKDKRLKRFEKNTKHVLNWTKILAKGFEVGVIVYTIVISGNSFTPLTAVFSVLTIIAWVVQLVLELIVMYVEARWELLYSSFMKDVEPVMHPVKTAKEWVQTNVGDKVVGAVAAVGAGVAQGLGHPIIAHTIGAVGGGVQGAVDYIKENSSRNNDAPKPKKEKINPFKSLKSKITDRREQKALAKAQKQSAKAQNQTPASSDAANGEAKEEQHV